MTKLRRSTETHLLNEVQLKRGASINLEKKHKAIYTLPNPTNLTQPYIYVYILTRVVFIVMVSTWFGNYRYLERVMDLQTNHGVLMKFPNYQNWPTFIRYNTIPILLQDSYDCIKPINKVALIVSSDVPFCSRFTRGKEHSSYVACDSINWALKHQ